MRKTLKKKRYSIPVKLLSNEAHLSYRPLCLLYQPDFKSSSAFSPCSSGTSLSLVVCRPPCSRTSSPFFLSLFLSSLASHYLLYCSSAQQAWRPWPPAWPAILTCCLHQLVSCVGKGSPHLPRVLPAAGDEKAPSQCYKILKKKLKSSRLLKGGLHIYFFFT